MSSVVLVASKKTPVDHSWMYAQPNPEVYREAGRRASLGVPINKAIRSSLRHIYGEFPENGVKRYVNQFHRAFPANEDVIARMLNNVDSRMEGQAAARDRITQLFYMATLCQVKA